jgi:hypothetical protein
MELLRDERPPTARLWLLALHDNLDEAILAFGRPCILHSRKVSAFHFSFLCEIGSNQDYWTQWEAFVL